MGIVINQEPFPTLLLIIFYYYKITPDAFLMVIYDISLKMDVFYMQEHSETLHCAFQCHARKRKRKKKKNWSNIFRSPIFQHSAFFSQHLQVDNTGEIFSVFIRVAEHTDKQPTSVACQQASITVLVQIHGFNGKPTESKK